jgi:Ca2+-binding EF-hand superfamily protein
LRAHLFAIALLAGSPIVTRGETSQSVGVDLTAVKTLLASGGNSRVSDAGADLMTKRLAKIRDDAAGRIGQEDTKSLLAACDTDRDGRVSLPEARAAVARARPEVDARASVADRLIAAVDGDGDGNASQTELTTYLGKKAALRAVVEPRAVKLWKAADANRDGAVDVMEARLLADQFGKLALYSGDEAAPVIDPTAWMQVVRVIERADADGSNAVSAAEVASTSVFKAQFAGIDRDRSGEVTAGELYAMAADLSKTAQRQTCATCPRQQQAGADKLNLLQGLLTLQ